MDHRGLSISARRLVPSLFVAGALSLASCGNESASVQVAPPPGVPTGTLTLTWTVEGLAAPETCDAVGASDLELVVYDELGALVADTFSNCADFGVTIELPEGLYEADVTLLDPGDRPVSTTLTLEALEIIVDTDLTSDIDFPPTSIL